MAGGRVRARRGAPEPPSSPGGDVGGLSSYELERLENMRRNAERMAALQLPALREVMEVEAERRRPAAAKGVSARKRKVASEPAAPRRRSSRLEGVSADGSEVHSEKLGDTLIRGSDGQLFRPGGGWVPPEAPRERHPLADPLPFRSLDAPPATDAAFLQLLARMAATPEQRAAAAAAGSGAAKKSGKGGGGGASADGLCRLRLREEDVAKVTRNGVTHLAFHPSPSYLLLAAGDKSGHVGLWNVDEGRAPGHSALPVTAAALEPSGGAADGSDSEDASAAAFDGTLSYAPHFSYVSGLRWVEGGARLLTSAYDGSLRALHPAAGGASALLHSSEAGEYSCMDATADGRTVLLGDKDGDLTLVDTRASAPGRRPAAAGPAGPAAAELHRKKVNTVHFEPGAEALFVTASTDTALKVWDLRAVGPKMRPVAEAAHAQACQSAYFAPDGSKRVVSTSFDDTVRIWDGAAAGLAPALLRVKHDNQTGRWVSPFRAVWGACSDAVIVGNMRRFVDVIDAGTGALRAQLHSDHQTAIASRSAVHPELGALAAATASGRIHVYR